MLNSPSLNSHSINQPNHKNPKHMPNLQQDLNWVSKYLPHQGTLQHFVHHNTLQALEEYDFEVACRIAKKLYGGYCFMEQKRYIEYIQLGKIAKTALRAQLKLLMQAKNYLHKEHLESFFELLLNPPASSLKHIIEKQLDEISHHDILNELMAIIEKLPEEECPSNPYYFPTYKDIIQQEYGVNIDDQINPMLSKFISSYADPGSAYWSNEYKAQGLWHCFKENYSSGFFLENHFAKKIHQELKHVKDFSVEQALHYYCKKLQVDTDNVKKYLLGMALRLRGWASLFNELEHHPEQRLDGTVFSIKEFLLVKLLFEYIACCDYPKSIHEQSLLHYTAAQNVIERENRRTEHLFLSIRYLQLNHLISEGKWLAESPDDKYNRIKFLRHLLKEQRLFLYQKAFERTYTHKCLYAFRQSNLNEAIPEHRKKSFQYITCIDDREESLRRYLEQVDPNCETFGIAGHFEMTMHFQAYNEVRARKLCPDSVKKTYLIKQRSQPTSQSRLSRQYAQAIYAFGFHSKTTLMAYLLTILVGFLSIIPFLIKIFFPRLDSYLKELFTQRFLAPLELQELIFVEEGNSEGLKYDEAAYKISILLKNIDLTENFSDFIYIVGHGSSSINNPHEYAYNCGACGGGEGRANASIFCKIANSPQIRTRLENQYQIRIPENTRFVSGYHDTCRDSIVWDHAGLNPEQMSQHHLHELSINQALKLNILERAKKFFNVSTNPTLAINQVLKRANDITEARPEYNHATNSLCIIGRRSLSKQLFLDRRSFLCSYNPEHDDAQGNILEGIMGAAIPVCAGINLEYYFSTTDSEVYGCGSKLNHNITCNYGVMSGFASDLRLGLSKQMVEIHEPRRILFIVDSKPEIINQILKKNSRLESLAKNNWIQLVSYDQEFKEFYIFQQQKFVPIGEVGFEFRSYLRSQDIPTDSQNIVPVAVLEKCHD